MELKDAFVEYLEAEREIARLEEEKKQADFEMARFLAEAKANLAKCEENCTRIMRETGVVEEIVEGQLSNFKLGFSTPRRTVDIVDVDAVPDEWVKTERKPMKKEIMAEFKDAASLPNWLQWKEGVSKFQWNVVKK